MIISLEERIYIALWWAVTMTVTAYLVLAVVDTLILILR